MSKKVMLPVQILQAASMGATVSSATIDATFQDNIGLEIAWTSANAVGVITVEASNSGDNFYPLTFDPALTQPASDNGGYLVNLNQLPYAYYRVTYTRTSGTGTLSVWATSKEI